MGKEEEEVNSQVWSKWRRIMKEVFKSQFWFWMIIILVFLNTVCSALEYPSQPQWMIDFLDKAEQVQLPQHCLERI